MRMLIAALAALFTLPAFADDVAAPTKERLTFLMDFAAEGLGVTIYNVPLPRIVYVPDETMYLTFYSPKLRAYAENTPNVTLATIGAMYQLGDGVMVLNRDVDHQDPENEYILVHELVHHVQHHYEMDKKVRCPQQLEEDAYMVSNLWVMATGHGKRVSGFDAFNRSLCRDD